MRNSIFGFNQARAIELELTIDDLLLLQYIMYANGEPTMSHIVENEISYVWLNHSKIQEDLPLLNISDGTLRNKLSKLKEKGLIASKMIASGPQKGSRTYYTITEKTLSLINNNSESTMSSTNDTINLACHSEMTPNNKLNNLITISYDESYDTTETSVADSLTNLLTQSKQIGYKALEDETLDKKTKSIADPENTGRFNNLVAFINDLEYSNKTKEILLEWYKNIVPGKITIKRLKEKLSKLRESVNSEEEMYAAIKYSYINGYKGFFPLSKNKDTEKYYAKTEIKPITEDMLAKNADGTLKEY